MIKRQILAGLDSLRRTSSFLQGGNRFALVWLSLYLTAGLLILFYHEMWRDELEAWLVARDTTLGGLFDHLWTVSHPALWYLTLKALLVLSPDPSAMQYLHLIIASATIFLLLRHAPFTAVEKILLIFGYFFLYEYGILCRNYAPALLLIFFILSRYLKPEKKNMVMATAMFLLINTHVLGILMALNLLVLFGYDHITSVKTKEKPHLASSLLMIVPLVLAFSVAYKMSIHGGLAQVWNSASHSAMNGSRVQYIAQSLWSSYVPIPSIVPHFWNSNLIPTYLARTILSVLCFFGAIFLLSPNRRALLFYITGTVSLHLFFLFFHPGFLRHHGFLFIIFIISYWLKRSEITTDHAPSVARWSKAKNHGFRTLLIAQSVAGLSAGILDIVYPFSTSKQACDYIKAQGLHQNMIIAGDWDYVAQSASAWLNQPIYYPARQDYGSYIIWNDPRRKAVTINTKPERRAYKRYVIDHLRSLAESQKKEVLLLSTYPQNLSLLKSFPLAIQEDEVFYLYVISPASTAIKALIQ